jgi:CBS-domain-containing membrane protein
MAEGGEMKAKDLMVSPVVSVPLGTNLEEVARLMVERRIGSVLVVDGEGRLVGIVTESDFLKERGIPFSTFRAPMLLGRFLDGGQLERILEEAKNTRVEEIMTSPGARRGPRGSPEGGPGPHAHLRHQPRAGGGRGGEARGHHLPL